MTQNRQSHRFRREVNLKFFGAFFLVNIAFASLHALAQEQSLESLEQQIDNAKSEQKRKQTAAKEQEARAAAARRKAAEPQDPAAIVLESGLTLSDWIILSRSEVERKNYDRVLLEGAGYSKKYPRVEPLHDIVESALQGKLSELDADSPDAARKNLPEILRLLEAFPEQASVNVAVGKAYHVLGEYGPALTRYRKALVLLPQDGQERRQLLDWFALANEKKPLVLVIAPIKKRPIPPELIIYEVDMADASKCFGRARAGIDYLLTTRGVYSSKIEFMAGKTHEVAVKNLAMDDGLSISEPVEVTDPDSSKQSVFVVGSMIGNWWKKHESWSGGSMAGVTIESNVSTSAIECPAPFLPLMEGKTFTVSRVETAVGRTIGGSDKAFFTGTDTHVNSHSTTVKILSPPISAANAMEKFAYLRLQGPSAERWWISEVEVAWSVRSRYVDKDGKESNRSNASENKGLFVEGPNVFVFPQTDLQPGWTTTIAELP